MEDYNHQPLSHFSDVPDCNMTEVTLNQEDHSYMFDDENTPVKACSDLGYHVTTTDDMNGKLEVHSETRSALKRRRMLQFEDQPETSLFSCENFSAVLKSCVSTQKSCLVFSYEPDYPQMLCIYVQKLIVHLLERRHRM